MGCRLETLPFDGDEASRIMFEASQALAQIRYCYNDESSLGELFYIGCNNAEFARTDPNMKPLEKMAIRLTEFLTEFQACLFAAGLTVEVGLSHRVVASPLKKDLVDFYLDAASVRRSFAGPSDLNQARTFYHACVREMCHRGYPFMQRRTDALGSLAKVGLISILPVAETIAIADIDFLTEVILGIAPSGT